MTETFGFRSLKGADWGGDQGPIILLSVGLLTWNGLRSLSQLSSKITKHLLPSSPYSVGVCPVREAVSSFHLRL